MPLAAYLQQLRLGLQAPGPCEPEVDDKELGVEDRAKFREEEDLKGGAVLKGVVEPGEGDDNPREGDLVFLHYSLLDEHQEVLCSTLVDHGGSGQPQPFVIGRGLRMLRGMELGVLEMRRGERAMLEIKADYAFRHSDSGMPLPDGMHREAHVVADVTLVGWYPGSSVKCVGPDGNIFLRTLRAGHGWETPRPPFEVAVHIQASTDSIAAPQADGEPFFSSDSGAPLTCALGSKHLPPGVEAALQAMQRQQQAVAYCPNSQLGGSRLVPGPPASPVGSTAAPAYSRVKLQLLDFSQESMSDCSIVRDMTGDGSVMKRIVRKGAGEFPIDCPLEDSTVRVNYRVRVQGQEQWIADACGEGQAAPFEFETGMGDAPEALDMCVRLMLRGEVAFVTSSWQYAYEGRQDAPCGVPAGSSVEFEVELVDFDRQPSQHAMSASDKLQRAVQLKEQGNALFKQDRTKLARQKYQKALKAVGSLMDLETNEEFVVAAATKAACLLNLARCAEREQEWGEAIGWCNKAISEDDGYAKAYFRRAVVSGCLGEYDSARSDLEICAQLDESTVAACQRELQHLERQEAAAAAKQRDSLKGFFNR